jgi:very-short-patch-repair endonuclease
MNSIFQVAFSPGSVRVVFLAEPQSAAELLSAWMEGSREGLRLVTCSLAVLPRLPQLLEQFVQTLAEAARVLWPDWYDEAGSFEKNANLSDPAIADQWTRQVVQSQRHRNSSWLKAALRSLRAGRRPSLPEFPLALEAQQLALALTQSDLLIAVCLEESDPEEERLLGFARGVEWLARETGAAVLAVLPASLKSRRELDGINFQTVEWKPPQAATATPLDVEEQKHLVCPIIGRPHPGSPGEQILSEYLSNDPELGSLFEFNQRVVTVFESRFLVDLVWAAGQVIIEVDGFGYHSSRSAFISDRHRDYELTLTGYLTLRLPHDFVVQDPELAIERIREFVRFRTRYPFSKSEVMR